MRITLEGIEGIGLIKGHVQDLAATFKLMVLSSDSCIVDFQLNDR